MVKAFVLPFLCDGLEIEIAIASPDEKAGSSKRAAAKSRTGHKKTSAPKARSRNETAAKTSALKRRAAKSKASPESKTTPHSVEEYFAAVAEPARSALHQIREAIRSVVPPEATEIISYKIPAFKHKKVLVWYGAFSNHCSLFPTAAVIEAFKDELKNYSTSKGTIHFPLDKPMPVELIKRLVKARSAQGKSKKRS